ncbi:YdaS family helix-turn-helix protein [Pelagerythrobacter marensis]|uniref:YdaS family helix-turn-helix protein n=1 Tax=Pelagerythrobacter marensis TaxID=543877 RepID=A0ABZ2D888_9SPHN
MNALPTPISPAEAFALAVERIDGGQTAMGKLCGKTQGAVSKRLAAKREIWAENVRDVEAATGISRHDLRPDLYPREDSPAQPPAGVPSSPAGGSSSALEGVRA